MEVRLFTNRVNWMLGYRCKESEGTGKFSRSTFETVLVRIALFVFFIFIWPVTFLCSACGLLRESYSFIKAKYKQYKIMKILSNPGDLKAYGKNRVQWCEKQIDFLKNEAIKSMDEDFKKPEVLGLSIPQKSFWYNFFSKREKEEIWDEFRWDEFAKKDFLQLPTVQNNFDEKYSLKKLDHIRLKMIFLCRQKHELTQPNVKAEVIKNIAEMSLIKATFKVQASKRNFFHSMLILLNAGLDLEYKYYYPQNDRLTYEGKKEFLSAGTDLQKYDDLVKAHNGLVEKHDYLVPYLQSPF